MKVLTLSSDSKTGFSLLTGINRAIIPLQLRRLTDSIREMGIIRPVVCCKTDILEGRTKTYILDGQHLYQAILSLKLDIPYTMVEVKDLKDLIEKIAKLNSSSKSWVLGDYILAWSNIYPDYKRLTTYMSRFNLEAGIVASVLSNDAVSTSGDNSATKSIKDGTFRIKNETESIEFLSCVTDALNTLGKFDRSGSRYFCKEFFVFYKNAGKKYNHAKVIAYLKKNRTMLSLAIAENNVLSDYLNRAL